jgi:hypothetical protein
MTSMVLYCESLNHCPYQVKTYQVWNSESSSSITSSCKTFAKRSFHHVSMTYALLNPRPVARIQKRLISSAGVGRA